MVLRTTNRLTIMLLNRQVVPELIPRTSEKCYSMIYSTPRIFSDMMTMPPFVPCISPPHFFKALSIQPPPPHLASVPTPPWSNFMCLTSDRVYIIIGKKRHPRNSQKMRSGLITQCLHFLGIFRAFLETLRELTKKKHLISIPIILDWHDGKYHEKFHWETIIYRSNLFSF